jgi:predicted dehydrogenase
MEPMRVGVVGCGNISDIYFEAPQKFAALKIVGRSAVKRSRWTPTHIAGVLNFASGAVGTLTTSFDVWSAQVPSIEIYGSEGTLSVPDPNTFGGPVKLRLAT